MTMSQLTKTFRVFISSTFTEIKEEGRILQRELLLYLNNL